MRIMTEKAKVSCIHCGTTNYFPLDISGKKVICGRCKNVLPLPGTTIEPEPEKANNLFQKSVLPILVDFYSPTCAPCQMMHPVLAELAKRRKGELMVARINVTAYPQMGAAFGVQGVPTFIVMRKGIEIGRTSGAMSEADLALWVASKI